MDKEKREEILKIHKKAYPVMEERFGRIHAVVNPENQSVFNQHIAEKFPDIMKYIDKLEEEIEKLRKLAYIGEHHFPNSTYKYRLEELVRSAEEHGVLERIRKIPKQCSCTCDEFCDGPCPVHNRENKLQDRVIQLENGCKKHGILECIERDTNDGCHHASCEIGKYEWMEHKLQEFINELKESAKTDIVYDWIIEKLGKVMGNKNNG